MHGSRVKNVYQSLDRNPFTSYTWPGILREEIRSRGSGSRPSRGFLVWACVWLDLASFESQCPCRGKFRISSLSMPKSTPHHWTSSSCFRVCWFQFRIVLSASEETHSNAMLDVAITGGELQILDNTALRARGEKEAAGRWMLLADIAWQRGDSL